MTDLRALLEEGRRARVFSHARAVVRLRGQTVFDDGPALADARFDLASVTKVMATTACLLRLSDAGRLPLDAPLRRWLPEAAVDASVEDLAFHRAGLPAFRPFFAEVASRHPALFELPRQAAPTLRAAVRAQVLERVCAVPAERGRCTAAVYSDLGFILLGEVLERVTGLPLDEAFAQHVARPLGLQAGFRRLSAASPDERVVTTGGTRPREPAPGQEGLWSCPTWPSLPGEVDDDNAWVMDGVAGHAGLFATAEAVAAFGQAVLEGWVRPPGGFGLDATTPGSTRAFGFDTPSLDVASCGPRFGRAGPRGALGHLGFTGTSLWVDLDRHLVVALLTNRVVHGRSNLEVRAFRPRFHEAVVDAFGG